jgi:hypothetical protein
MLAAFPQNDKNKNHSERNNLEVQVETRKH